MRSGLFEGSAAVVDCQSIRKGTSWMVVHAMRASGLRLDQSLCFFKSCSLVYPPLQCTIEFVAWPICLHATAAPPLPHATAALPIVSGSDVAVVAA